MSPAPSGPSSWQNIESTLLMDSPPKNRPIIPWNWLHCVQIPPILSVLQRIYPVNGPSPAPSSPSTWQMLGGILSMDSSTKIGSKSPRNWLHLVQIPPILSISHTNGAVFSPRMTRPLLPAVPVVGRTSRVTSPWILHPRLGQNPPGTGFIWYKSPPF
jgi:hypothetical protein